MPRSGGIEALSLVEHLNARALELGVPLSVQLDLTWRCNERCVHCYLGDETLRQDRFEMTSREIKTALSQLAEAGTFFLTISGGEPLLRPDCFEILEYARSLRFNVKLKTNALLIGAAQAESLRNLNIEQIQVSIYSHRNEIHDAITGLHRSLQRSVNAIRLLRAQGLKVSITNVVMASNFADVSGVQRLAEDLGASLAIDPTITPMLNGDTSLVALSVSDQELHDLFHSEQLFGNITEFCAPPPRGDDAALGAYPCSAGHTSCYVSPQGDVYPCVQFPVVCGNLLKQDFATIWRNSKSLREIRSIRLRDVPACSGCPHIGYCTRCPGLAHMEGSMHGKSSLDCRKAFARTAVPPSGHSGQEL